MTTLRATTFKHSQHSFLEVLDQHDIKYNHCPVPVGVPMATGISVEIVITITGGWGALAIACLAWASVRKSRKINVTTKDKQVFWLEGYSADEAAKILAAAQQISPIETKPERDAHASTSCTERNCGAHFALDQHREHLPVMKKK